MSGLFRVFSVAVRLALGGVMLVELFGAVRTFELVAFAGHAQHRNGHDKQGEKFHRRAL